MSSGDAEIKEADGLKLINETQYENRHLRKIINLAYRNVQEIYGRELSFWESIEIKVMPRDDSYYSGRAWLNGNRPGGFKINMENVLASNWGGDKNRPPHILLWIPRFDATEEQLEFIADHELHHSFGEPGEKFGELVVDKNAEQTPLRRKPVKPEPEPEPKPEPKPEPPKRDLMVERLQRKRELLTAWERKLKLAKTKVLKLTRDVGARERRLANRPEKIEGSDTGAERQKRSSLLPEGTDWRTHRFKEELENEIAHRINAREESREDELKNHGKSEIVLSRHQIIKELMADEQSMAEFSRELNTYGVWLGVYVKSPKPHSRHVEYFWRDGESYEWFTWKPLDKIIEVEEWEWKLSR